MKILAVDPGGTTGWASWQDGEVTWGQIRGGLLAVKPLVDWLADRALEHRAHDSHLIIERYTIGERTVKFSRQSDALEITGLLRFEAQRHNIAEKRQLPRDAMRMWTDERLRAFGWWARGEEHARDALRHLGLFLTSKRMVRLLDPTWRGAL